ncbi:MAG: SbcC/MukB-like Walker B domain-containing protein [Capnocytophaga sp.]|nr:SbcC/MukB-like Walker B domain-containing protein [Capnocytophaga sp.]
MKILSIKFKNINSLEGEHYIDFENEPFKNSYIFAITGATGSGKSTILDVICLAIYNKTPRINKVTPDDILKTGAIITRGKNEAYAQVKYQCEKGIFTSEWSIRTKRTGNIDNVKMFVYDANGKAINQKKDEATEINIHNIGLNYEQFVKSIVLAQGDFSLFLKSNKKERSAILEQITGTEIYRELGKLAFRKNKDNINNISLLESKKVDIQDKILSEEEFISYEKQFQENEQKINQLREEDKQYTQQIKLKKEIRQQEEILSNIIENIHNNENKYIKFIENKGNKLSLHKKTDSFSEILYIWKDKKENISLLEDKIKKIQTENEDLNTQYNNFIINISDFVKETCNKDTLKDKLLSFQDKILALQEQKQEKLNTYKTIAGEITSELKNFYPKIDINIQENNFYTTIYDYLEEYKRKKEYIKGILGDISLEKSKELIEKEQQELKIIQEKEIKCIEINSIINNKEQKVKEIQLKQIEVENLPDIIYKNKEKLHKEELVLKNYRLEKENNDLKKSLEEHRKHLKQGEPCPLCGSKHHIYANDEKFEDNEEVNKINQQENIVKKLQNEIVSDENKLQIISKQIEKLIEEKNNLEKLIDSKIKHFQEEYKEDIIDKNWVEIKKIKEETINNLITYQNLCTYIESGERILPLHKSVIKIIEEGKVISKEISEKIGNKNIIEEVSLKLQQYIALETKIIEIKKQTESLEKEHILYKNDFDNVVNELENKVKENNFSSIENALESRLSYQEVNQLEKEQKEIEEEKNQLVNKKQLIEQDYLDKKNKDILSNEEDLLLKQKENISKIELLEEENKKLYTKIHIHQDNLKEFEQLSYKIQQEIEKNEVWNLLNKLIGDAQGDRFNNFVQDLTLIQLLKLANKHLLELSPRYLLSEPNKNENDSLIVVDRDMGSQRRSVKTLSGGESFLISLALALALSDLASNNVKINSLFIDEGFGMLDPEALDQTLDTLERLQEHSQKRIGIISHIDALKERITTQIKINQNGSGLSTLKVFQG